VIATSRSHGSFMDDLADITRVHANAFAEKKIEWVHELVDGNHVAHHVRFVLVHSGR
jgi:hypothetical protein